MLHNTDPKMMADEAVAGRRTRLALVLNENAGALLANGGAADLVRQHLAATSMDVHEPAEGGLPDRLRAAAADADIVVVAGGDGTVACAADAVAGSDVALGILACGTMNLLAKDLRLPIDDLPAAADVIAKGKTRRIDIGMAGGQPFLCACMIGSPARMGRHRERARRLGKLRQWPRILRAALFVLLRPRNRRISLEVDGVPHRMRGIAITITVGALDDATGRLFGRSCLDAGILTAYVVHRRSVLELLRTTWRLAHGRPGDAAVSVFTGRAFSLRGSDSVLRVMVDGESHIMNVPVRFSVRPGALGVVVP